MCFTISVPHEHYLFPFLSYLHIHINYLSCVLTCELPSLCQQKKDLAVAQAAADRAMEEISKALSSATERRSEVDNVKRTVAENEQKTQERKGEIEAELAEIQPVLESAKLAVGSIKSEHLNEIR